jgi:hypothetical protein
MARESGMANWRIGDITYNVFSTARRTSAWEKRRPRTVLRMLLGDIRRRGNLISEKPF